MAKNSERKQKLINALKGVITKSDLRPFSVISADGSDQEYALFPTFENAEGKTSQLFYKVELCKRVLELAEKAYPAQMDRELVSSLIREILEKWVIEGGKESENLKQLLEEYGEYFTLKIEAEIKAQRVFLPIEGLKLNIGNGLPIGKCVVYSKDQDSEFSKVLKQARNRLIHHDSEEEKRWDEKVKAYFVYDVTAHQNRAGDLAIQEASLALDILRLYMASHYFDENERDIVRRMGLYGSLYTNEQLHIFFVSPNHSIESQFPGRRTSRTIYKNYQLNEEFVEYMNENGLSALNKFIQSPQKKLDVGPRLLRAVSWFSKAVTAKNIADSYLMYAIAIEAILSESRTPKETYANRIASLITGHKKDEKIYPVGGYLSKEFAKKLRDAKSERERFKVIYDRVIELFGYRNDIAHGAVLDAEINDLNLLDFETIVQNTIFAFLRGGWNSFDDFKEWVNTQIKP